MSSDRIRPRFVGALEKWQRQRTTGRPDLGPFPCTMQSRHLAILMVAFALYQVALAATSAEANHILVDSEDRCNAIKVQILDSPDQFEAVILPRCSHCR